MPGQWCCVPEPPWAGALGEAGAEGVVVDGLELAGGDGLGVAASTGAENAMIEPIAAPPTRGTPSSSSLRLSGIFASCNVVGPRFARAVADNAAAACSGSRRRILGVRLEVPAAGAARPG